jgi:hypothetical protein
MSPEQEPDNLEQLLDRLEPVAHDERPQVSLGALVQQVGRRSFGVLLLLAGLITLAPVIGDIPGVPTLMALLVLLTAAQLLWRRPCVWLPGWLVRRSVKQRKVDKALGWMRRPARAVDRLLRPRLHALVENGGLYGIAATCLAIGLMMPPMELVPFSANGAGAALTAFGLALIARDGLLALVAYVVLAATVVAVLYFGL